MTNKYPINSLNVEYKQFDDVKPFIKSIMNDKMSKATSNGFGPKTKNVIVTFDTETTNAKDNGIKKPFIYSYCITIMSMNVTMGDGNIAGRAITIRCGKIEEFKDIVRYLCKVAGCKVSRKIINSKQVENGTEDHNNYDNSEDVYLNFYVHNLPFDFSFIIDEFSYKNLFCSAPHKPYYALTWEGARFVDTVVLTMKTLEQLGKSLTYFDVKKQVGDLDYNKIRTSDTTYTEKELGYIYDDTITLAAYIWELAATEYDGELCKLPLTQTGKVRSFTRKLCFGNIQSIRNMIDYGFTFGTLSEKNKKYHNKRIANDILGMEAYKKIMNGAKGKERSDLSRYFESYCKLRGKNYHKMIKCLTIKNYRDYKQMAETYSGGFTHANPNLVGKINKNVASFDFKSSYPAVIVSEEFPMTMYTRRSYSKEEFLERLKHKKEQHKAYMFKLSFRTIINKLKHYTDSYFSESQLYNVTTGKALIDDALAPKSVYNGRVAMANDCYTYITDADWETVEKVYDIYGAEFSDIMEFDTAPLPQPILMATLYFYAEKTKLKHIPGREKDYLRSKGMLNSIYGMMVQNPLSPIITYRKDGSWYRVPMTSGNDIENALKDYNTSKNRFLWYPWGIYVAAYARRNLWTGIIACGSDYIYSDTDSIKILNKEKHVKYIESYNKQIIEKIKKICKENQIPFEFTSPENEAQQKQQIGIWDADDGYYSEFKTLGAKRYVDIDKETNELEITIAGLSKTAGRDWMIKKSKVEHKGSKIIGDPTPIFDLFNDEMTVPVGKAGKLTHTYVSRYKGFDITDYQGHKTHIEDGSGCFLEPAGFTLSVAERFIKAYEELQKGYKIVLGAEI